MAQPVQPASISQAPIVRDGASALFSALRNYLSDLSANLLAQSNGISASAGVTTATSTTAVKTTTAITYRIDGAAFPLAASDNFWLFTSDAANTIPTGNEKQYLLTVNAAGTAGFVASPVVTTGSSVTPAVPAGTAAIGILKVAMTATFTPGTTTLGAAGVTATFYQGNLASTLSRFSGDPSVRVPDASKYIIA